MSIKIKTLFWLLIPSIIIATIVVTFYYFHTRKAIRRNVFDKLEIAAYESRENVQLFLKEKEGRTFESSSDRFLRDCTEEITAKKSRREYYTNTLNNHLITSKKFLDPNILDVFVVDLNGKVIASTKKDRVGQDVSGEGYFTEVEFLSAFAGEPHYDNHSKTIVIDFSTMLLSKIGREVIGIIVSRIKLEQQEDQKQDITTSLQNDGWNYSKLISTNKARIMDFSSDGFIRDCAEELTRREDRVQYYINRLNTHLAMNKNPLDPEIIAVFVTDLSGNIIGSSEFGLLGKNVSEELYFLETIKTGSCISDLHKNPGFKHSIIEVSRLLLSNKEQNPIGIIVNRYSGDNLKNITHSGILEELGQEKLLEGLGDTGELYVVNRDKVMITGSRFIKDAAFKQIVDTEGVRAAFNNGDGMIGIYTDYRGIRVLGVSKHIEKRDWVILAEKDVSEAFAPITRLRDFTIIAGIMSVIVIVAVATLLAIGITRPIRKLIEGTKRIASGDLEHPILIGKRKDEIKELSESFNLMMYKLRETKESKDMLFLQIKASLREKEILLREIYHRTKNNMQVICSLLNLQSKYFKNEQVLKLSEETQNRIKSMAIVHEKLYQSKNLSSINLKIYIEDLTHSLFSSYLIDTNKILLKITAEDIPLTIDSAVPCGLVINEIITNSLKYAFPEGRDGEIRIDLHSRGEGLIELRIADDGISLPEDFDLKKTNTLGFQIITNLIENQLHGEIDLNLENGVEFRIKFKEQGYTVRI